MIAGPRRRRLPNAAAIGAVTYGVSRIFGTGALGPIVVSILVTALIAAMFGRRLQRGPAITAPAEGAA